MTAFVVESYKWLQEDTDDVSVRLLAFIANQLANSSTPFPPALVQQPFSVSPSEVRINSVWFLSLALALTTVLIGILCLQWLREFQRDASLSHKDAVALRQMRYEGLLHWRVPDILYILPILLQTSLVLFFCGLLELLWIRNTIVAAFITAVVGGVMLFLAATTALPAIQYVLTRDPHMRVYQCPYKSPQSWLFYQTSAAFFLLLDSLHFWWSSIEEDPSSRRLLKSRGDLSWLTFDMRWRQLRDAQEVVRGTAKKLKDSEDIIHGLQWLNATFSQSVEAVYPIHHAIVNMELEAAETTVSGFYLDGQIDNATLRVMLDDRFSPLESQKRDILSAYYLNIHQSLHPVLKISYIDTVIRILNSQDAPRPFYDWLSEILQELASAESSAHVNTDSPHSLLNPEIKVRVLLCVKNVILRRRALQTSDLVDAWALLHRLLAPSFIRSQDPDDDYAATTGVSVRHLRLACALFEAFEMWVESGREIERWERVKLCAEGMLTVFGGTLDMQWTWHVCPDMVKAHALVSTLNTRLATLGGPAEVLMRDKRWLEYWEGYNESDWTRLTKTFREMEGNEGQS